MIDNTGSQTGKYIGEATSGYGAVFTLYLSQRFSNFSCSQTSLEGLGGWVVLVVIFLSEIFWLIFLVVQLFFVWDPVFLFVCLFCCWGVAVWNFLFVCLWVLLGFCCLVVLFKHTSRTKTNAMEKVSGPTEKPHYFDFPKGSIFHASWQI